MGARTTIVIKRADMPNAPELLRGSRSAKVAFTKYRPHVGQTITLDGLRWEVVDVVVDSENVFLPTMTILVKRNAAERARLGLPPLEEGSSS